MFGRLKVLMACMAVMACIPSNAATHATFSLSGEAVDPLAGSAHAIVLLFVRADCPITNRYAPELTRIADEFHSEGVRFWLVYPDRSETVAAIKEHIAQYHLPGTPLRDPAHQLAAYAQVTVAPEVAVFDHRGRLQYHGRIDDRYVDIGKSKAAAQTHDLQDAIYHVLAGTLVPHPATRAVGCSLADVQ